MMDVMASKNHQPHHCLLNRLFKENIKVLVTGLCAGNSPAQMASNAEMFPFDDVIMK